jgi:hypothetical protein
MSVDAACLREEPERRDMATRTLSRILAADNLAQEARESEANPDEWGDSPAMFRS